MSKEKIILYSITIFVLSAMVYFSYSSQQSAATQTSTVPIPSHETLKTLETEEVETLQEKNEEIGLKTASHVTVENDDSLSDKAEISDDTFEKTEDDEYVDDNAPIVERNKLIGGANVEWEEPKSKDPNNKLGEPPM